MLYLIRNFEFDSECLVLSRDDETIEIRHNEAKLLALFLENNEKVISKEEILTSIWQDKVVSDQAVFQNISHLRNIFGNDAIKTFSKRGYQWQLKFKAITDVDKANQGADRSTHYTNRSSKNRRFFLQPFAFAATIIFGVFLAFGILNKGGDDSSTQTISYIPFVSSDDSNFIIPETTSALSFKTINEISAKQFLTSHQLEYRNLSSENVFILAGEVRKYNRQYHLDFLLKGPYADWTGQISAFSKEALIERLVKHLDQPLVLDLVSKQQSPEIKQASLSIAHEQSPDDLIVLEHLVKIYFQTYEHDKAMVMSEKLVELATLQENVQYIGNALLNQSEILTNKELYELSAEKLSLAQAQFEKINDLKRQADALEKQSWLDHQARDYEAIKASLLKSAELALAAKDIPRELHALTYLSVMSKKYREDKDKYYYLQQAENKMDEYQLPIYHYAKIPFHYAIFTKERSGKEPHWKRVLEYTELNPDYWVAQSSRKQLLEFYISQDRLQEAEALVTSVKSENAPNAFLKVLLAKAKKDNEQFFKHAQKTFELAQLAGYRGLSLDVALMLCEHPESEANFDFYSQYIRENSTKYWRIDNEKKLLALNL